MSSSSTAQPSLPPINDLNALPDEQFLAVVNVLFETAPPLAQRLLIRRPYTSYESLISTAETILLAALTEQEVVEVINAHPRIGAPTASLSALSKVEQGGGQSGGSAATTAVPLAETLARLAELNTAYEAKYGFCFMVFVNGRSRAEIVPVLEDRLAHGHREQEIRTALEAMIAIARDRLTKLQISKL
ncbi:Oxo-4-hydroxy-4-carboxy-5-ureidoimidazoline decarboxylase [Syncephalis fuscata]|nr:Oxo-4-hydroxy-4-carboxy-5-ureidoimidazoline decarboxylase [Syncephalis fuscata]